MPAGQEGYDADACFDGAEALYYARQPIYDLILPDRMPPSVDGAAVLKKLRMENISVPVIFIAALGDLADRIRGLDMGKNLLQEPSGQCSFSKKEGTLLEIFLRNPGQILSRLSCFPGYGDEI